MGNRIGRRPWNEVSVSKETRHWHVTLTLAGEAVEPLLVRAALQRLSEERPFVDSMNFTGTGAELRFWDEGATMLDVASLALRLWSEHRESASLPAWEVVGLEVVEKAVRDARGGGKPVTFETNVKSSLTF
ncbi:MAG: hypothetical protein JWR35_3330 [Marmoricola sp.]|jgi:hypothetical protein|nr:hypothetical protein [Marmoricola sp.]